jgi:hypothetical protein
MNCTGVDKGPLLTTCRFNNICYDGRAGRPYITVKEHDPHLGEHEAKYYDGLRDWLFFRSVSRAVCETRSKRAAVSDDSSVVVPRVGKP